MHGSKHPLPISISPSRSAAGPYAPYPTLPLDQDRLSPMDAYSTLVLKLITACGSVALL